MSSLIMAAALLLGSDATIWSAEQAAAGRLLSTLDGCAALLEQSHATEKQHSRAAECMSSERKSS